MDNQQVSVTAVEPSNWPDAGSRELTPAIASTRQLGFAPRFAPTSTFWRPGQGHLFECPKFGSRWERQGRTAVDKLCQHGSAFCTCERACAKRRGRVRAWAECW